MSDAMEAGVKRPATNAPTGRANKRLKKLSPEQMTLLEYRKKVEACAASVNAPEALRIFHEMKEKSIPMVPYLYQMILNVCGQSTVQENIVEDAFQVYEDMKTSLQSTGKKKHPVDETSYSALIKLCAKQKNTDRALELIKELEENDVSPKLRTFAPLLQAFADLNELERTWWTYNKLISHHIEPTEAEFIALFQVCTSAQNSELFYKALDIYCDKILVPSPNTWDVLKNWFSQSFHTNGWKISVGKVDENGISSITGDKLASIELCLECEASLLDKVENLVCTTDERSEQWAEFKTWLDTHGPFDVLIDGANVGYFNQNFEGGGFNYKQIEIVLKEYQKKGMKPLILLHKRRTKDHQVPLYHRSMVQQWKDDLVMYNCRPGNNDDWYWLYGAIKFSGRTLVVSNDEMRDHHFQMIHNEDFRRWKERHLVHYDIRGNHLELFEPTVYSKRSQKKNKTWYFPNTLTNEWLVIEYF